jgi:ATP-dependent DNA helicase PIF1
MRVCIDGDAAVLAGTGKSLLLRAIIMALKKKHSNNPEVVSVTASTGMAASNIGGTVSIASPVVGIGGPRYLISTPVTGMTLHSWGAIAPSVDNIDKLLSYIKTARPALMRWKKTQILIIDEGTAHISLCVCMCGTESYILVVVSMVDGHLFEKICEIAARLRKKTDRPFGGIQVGICTSDHSVYQW